MDFITKVGIDQIRFNFPYDAIKTVYVEGDPWPEIALCNWVFKLRDIMGHFEPTTALNGYTQAFCFGDSYKEGKVTVSFNRSRRDMGILVDFTAGGKRLYEQLASLKGKEIFWKEIIKYAYGEFNAHITRIDVAVDLINTDFDLNNLNHRVVDGQVKILNSRGHEIKGSSYKIIKTLDSVQTLYIGSRKSDAFLRIYDKRQEQLAKNKILFGLNDTINNWIRIEGEFKHKLAREIGRKIKNTDQMHDLLLNLVSERWKFVKLSNDVYPPSSY